MTTRNRRIASLASAAAVFVAAAFPTYAQDQAAPERSMPGMDMKPDPSRQVRPDRAAPMDHGAMAKPKAPGHAMSMEGAPQQAAPATPGAGVATLPNLADRAGWPEPVADRMPFGSLLFDLLEYRTGEGTDFAPWDVLGWRGGDYQRVWFKSEGTRNFPSRAGGDAEVQVLYGRLIAPFFDFQAGLRYDRQWGPGGSRGRALAAIGVQGLAPYRYEVEPTLFISQDGDVSARFTASQDILFTQRLILQPRFETNAAVQSVPRFGVGKGLNDVELGLRLRYEIRREIAPYVGISWKRSFGETATFMRADGGKAAVWQALAGVRLWF